MADIIEFQPRSRDEKRKPIGNGAQVIPWRKSETGKAVAAEDAGLSHLIEPPLKGVEE